MDDRTTDEHSGEDDGSAEVETLASILECYSCEELVAAGPLEDDLAAARWQVREHLARQFVARHCPEWTCYAAEAVISCADFSQPLWIGELPGEGARLARDVAHDYRTAGAGSGLLLLRQASADPRDAGISCYAPSPAAGGALAQRELVSLRFSEQAPVLVSYARTDPGLCSSQRGVPQLFVSPPHLVHAQVTAPLDGVATDGVATVGPTTQQGDAARPSSLTVSCRSGFRELLARVQDDLKPFREYDWDVGQLLAMEADLVAHTTAMGRMPSEKDRQAIRLGARAVRNLFGIDAELTWRLAELDYIYRRYEVLR